MYTECSGTSRVCSSPRTETDALSFLLSVVTSGIYHEPVLKYDAVNALKQIDVSETFSVGTEKKTVQTQVEAIGYCCM